RSRTRQADFCARDLGLAVWATAAAAATRELQVTGTANIGAESTSSEEAQDEMCAAIGDPIGCVAQAIGTLHLSR
ncbi:MAG: hypothetical protein L0G72_14600, partial [Brevibacterium aurantiacum]|nr:hypothetical protein [Brevibacterium aurantiacum]